MNLDKVIHIKCEAKSYYQLDELNHFQGKLKSIDQDDFDKLKKSLVKDGLPIGFHVWIDKKNKVWTIDGHHRVLALKALREEGYDVPSLPCVIVQAKDKKEAAKAVLINNSKYAKINQESLSDFMIGFELNLDDLNFLDLPDLNMDDFGLDEKTKEGLTDDDDVPEVAQNIHGVTLGDIYTLGNHRLMCGDSTSIDAVEKLMDGQKADMVFTDPPYGMFLNTDYTGMNGVLKDGSHIKRNNHKQVIGDHDDFKPELITTIFNLFPDTKEVFLWGADYYADILPERNEGSWIVWDKTGNEDRDKGFGSSFELCWSKQKHKRTFARIWWQGIFGVKDDQKGRVHPTQKPVQLAEWFFDRWGKETKSVIDLFGGSGSTLIACEKTNRKCFMMELDPHYCSVIIERWQNFTGLKAKLITE